VKSNLGALEFPGLTQEQKKEIDRIYEEDIKPLVHQLW